MGMPSSRACHARAPRCPGSRFRRRSGPGAAPAPRAARRRRRAARLRGWWRGRRRRPCISISRSGLLVGAALRAARAKGITRVQRLPRADSIWAARSEARVRSWGVTLAEVSTSIAAATLVSYTVTRGSASAISTAARPAAFKESATRRAESRHSQNTQTAGSKVSREHPGMRERHQRPLPAELNFRRSRCGMLTGALATPRRPRGWTVTRAAARPRRP